VIAVDTHVIVWDALRSRQVSRKAREAMDRANAADGIILCDISLWEIAMLMTARRLKVDAPYSEFMSYSFQEKFFGVILHMLVLSHHKSRRGA
jgi:PIN domain nuclease of toxin-antitoxin system